MLINCSNHPYEIWNVDQREAAKAYGEVVDLPFPAIDPACTKKELRDLVDSYADRIKNMQPEAVMAAGEFSFTFMLVDKLLQDGIKVLCSRSERITKEVRRPDGVNEKTAQFRFAGFFEYTYYREAK